MGLFQGLGLFQGGGLFQDASSAAVQTDGNSTSKPPRVLPILGGIRGFASVGAPSAFVKASGGSVIPSATPGNVPMVEPAQGPRSGLVLPVGAGGDGADPPEDDVPDDGNPDEDIPGAPRKKKRRPPGNGTGSMGGEGAGIPLPFAPTGLAAVAGSAGGWTDARNDAITGTHPNTGFSSDTLFVNAQSQPTVFVLAIITDGGSAPSITADLGLTWTLQATVNSGTATLYLWTASVDDPSTIGGGLGDDMEISWTAGHHIAAILEPVGFPDLTTAPSIDSVTTATRSGPGLITAAPTSIPVDGDLVLEVLGIYYHGWNGANQDDPSFTYLPGWDQGASYENSGGDDVALFGEEYVSIQFVPSYVDKRNLSDPPTPEQAVFGDDALSPTVDVEEHVLSVIHEVAAVTLVFAS